jgi:hypothetical protein
MRSLETHLDFSSTQPNRPSHLFAHGRGRKAGLKETEMIHWVSPKDAESECLPGQGGHEGRQIVGAW